MSAHVEFFERIGKQGFDPRLGHVRGSVRFDVESNAHAEHWRVVLDHGAIQVSDDAADADCVIRLDVATLDRLVTGEANPTSALLRGLIGGHGDIDLMLHFQRLFPAGRPAPAENAPAGREEAP
jgi:predicted lipid carrier protein YhbT